MNIRNLGSKERLRVKFKDNTCLKLQFESDCYFCNITESRYFESDCPEIKFQTVTS